MKALLIGSLLFIKLTLLPNQSLLAWMGIAITLDFITGFTKAIFQGKARTSNGMRRTITKFIQYGGALVVGVILAHAAEEQAGAGLKAIVAHFQDALVVFVIYIEVTSIFENLVAIDDKSVISRFFFQPMLRILTAQFKKLPLVQGLEAASPDPKK